jgi:hypothetical protein
MDTVKQSLEQKIKTDDYDYNYDREPDRWNFQYNYE